jgi:hypothetical protein
MIKKMPFKLHGIYQVWNEHAMESIYFNRKPTKEDLRVIVRKNNWDFDAHVRWTDGEVDQFVKDFIHVFKMDHLWYDDSENA